MSYGWSSSYVSESYFLSHILDDAGLTPDDRQKMIYFAGVLETVHTVHSICQGWMRSIYFFGSRSEGATTPDLHSDIDYLICHEDRPVITELSQWIPLQDNGFLISDENTHPGYVKIQQMHHDKPEIMCACNEPFCIRDAGGRVLRLSLDYVQRKLENVSGPAETRPWDTGVISSDYVTCRRCIQWPPLAENWLLRRRPFNWPTCAQLQEMKKYGCFVVPIGHTHSLSRNVEWRLSFTQTERDLVRMFNDTQVKVFVVLKMIKTSFIKPVVGDTFSTYHCKVCVFWMAERTDPRIWKTENLIMCVLMCLKCLYQWLAAGFCPDYFVPENNLYDRKLYGSTLASVRKLIGAITEKTVLLWLKRICLDDVGERLKLCIEKGMFVPQTTATEKRNEEKLVREIGILSNVPVTRKQILFSLQTKQTDHYKIMTSLRSMMQSTQHVTARAAEILFPFVQINERFYEIAKIIENNADGYTPEMFKSMFTEFMEVCKKTDVTSEKLKLVGALICISQTEKASVLFGNVEETLKPHCLPICGCYEFIMRRNDDFTEKVVTENWTTEELLQKCAAYCVMYTTLEMPIVPKAMRMEFFRISATPANTKANTDISWRHMAVADSRAYVHFLKYQLMSKIGKEKEKEEALVNLMGFIAHDQYQAHKETSYNLLGYCWMEEGNLDEAFWCFARSIEVRPIHNAAMWHICTILPKLVNDMEVNIYTRQPHS
ncbi:hypothetical protein CHS0354_013318 [Potamilus streckersoni]|uniref:Mab-21-like HhH/H2TH-like domain-containing protein n=1 Tax=Potamilus streckersoni TaxID=2493646 RepID=A0AAE0VY94_9BIVA|nr:hypothetical protein CHS0354_013318 [Potamilus streckersoni]